MFPIKPIAPVFRLSACFSRSCAALLSALLFTAAIACTGNGGSVDSMGETYHLGSEGGGNTSNHDATSSSSTGSDYTAQDLWNASNAGDPDKIIELISSDGGDAGTTTVTLQSSVLGLPAGGTVTLRITGNTVQYSQDASADSSGTVTFTVPRLQTNSTVTVELTVRDATGTVLFTGTDTQVVDGEGNLQVGLITQFWTLPSQLTVTASPNSILYDSSTWNSSSATVSLAPIAGAPAGAVFSYAWTDENGTPVTDASGSLVTGTSFSRTVYQLLDGTPPVDDVTRTFTVTVTYIDPAGETETRTGSASVTVGGPVDLPDFTVNIAAPASKYDAECTADAWALLNLTDTFSITPVSSGDAFPGGTNFSWTVSAAGGSTVTRSTNGSTPYEVSPSALGLTAASIGMKASPTAITVSCTASNSRSLADKPGTPGSAAVFLIYLLPDFTITVAPPSTYMASKSSGTTYALKDLTAGFSLTPVAASGSAFPAGTTFEWSVQAEGKPVYSTTSALGTPGSASPTSLGLSETDTWHKAADAKGISVSCTAKNPRATDKAGTPNNTAKAFLLYTLPDFTISVSMDTAGYSAANSDLTGTDPVYALVDTGKDFTLTATPGSGSFPADTEFEWTVRGTTLTGDTQKDRIITISPAAMGLTDTQGLANSVSAAKNAPTGISISCTAKHADAVADVDGTDRTVNVYLLTIPDFKVEVTIPAGFKYNTDSDGDKVYMIKDSEMATASFKFEAVPEDDSESFPNSMSFEWDFLSSEQTTPDVNTTASVFTGSSTAPSAATEYTVTCTAKCGSIEKGPVQAKLKLGPGEITLANLKSYLQNLPTNDADHPYVLPAITGLTTLDDVKSIKSKLVSNRYVDLSLTQLPDDLTSLSTAFRECTTIVYPPSIPSSVTSMYYCFEGCTNLKTAPVLPGNLSNLSYCFQGCENLEEAPEIPSNVTTMQHTFKDCKKLTDAPVIPVGVTDLISCFEGCSKLVNVPPIA
ncbi:MAG: leucine-rich repeat domain-containing protein, partial [Treponema sp.]|nr:leucine-rich repeat domain-containing protein [Treponema sp.]